MILIQTETKEIKYMLGIYDCIFKAIMLNKDNIDYLKKLIHMITKIPEYALENIKVENVEHIKENKKDKKLQSDIIVSIENTIINLEMNKDYYEGVLNKNDAYIFKISSSQYNENESYTDIKQVIQINFNNFDYFKKEKEIYKFEYKEESTNITLDNNPIKYYIDLSFIRKKCYNDNGFNKADEFEKYCLILMEESDIEMKKIIGDDELLKKVAKNIEKLNEDKSIVVWYDAEKEAEKVRKTQLISAEKKGKEEGIKETKEGLAKKMLKDGLDINTIIKYTELSKEEITSIANEDVK